MVAHSASRPARLAVLIDADNTSAKIADGLFSEIAKIGEASVRRIYGDFSGPNLKSWAEILAKHAIIPQQNFAHTVGKNASDIALVIDAMDLLHTGRFEGFCLVSSDSDFTRLAARIREHGVDVFGFGKQNTPESFRQACRRFIFTELLGGEGQQDKAGHASSVAPLKPPSAAVPLLREAITQVAGDDGWADLGGVGSRLIALAPDFDQRTFGHAKLVDLVRSTGTFEVDRPEGRGMRVRFKPVSKPAKRSRS